MESTRKASKKGNESKHNDRKLRKAETPELLIQRRSELAEIIDNHADKLLEPRPRELIKIMKNKGWKYDKNTFARDREALARSNTFALKLGEYGHSQRMEDIDKKIRWVIQEAKTQYLKEWTIKTATRKVEPDKTITEAKTVSEIPGAKNMFLNTILKGTQLLDKMSSGENVHRACAMLGNELDTAHEKIEALKAKLLEKGVDQKEIETLVNP